MSTAGGLRVKFSLANVGPRIGAEVAQVYLEMPAKVGEPPRRLVAWKKVVLQPNERQMVDITIDPKMLSIFNVTTDTWDIVAGSYNVLVGSSSRDIHLKESVELSPVH